MKRERLKYWPTFSLNSPKSNWEIISPSIGVMSSNQENIQINESQIS